LLCQQVFLSFDGCWKFFWDNKQHLICLFVQFRNILLGTFRGALVDVLNVQRLRDQSQEADQSDLHNVEVLQAKHKVAKGSEVQNPSAVRTDMRRLRKLRRA
jgi:hypothetical protein